MKLGIKICGLTRLEDAKLAASLGAWALGFIFYRASPRFVDPGQVGKMVPELPSSAIRVGVFVNPTLEEVVDTVTRSRVNWVQFHGNEGPDFCENVMKKLPKESQFIKAFRPKLETDLSKLAEYPKAYGLLIDSGEGSGSGSREFGGTGKTANWNLALQARSYGKVILAGGIRPENIAEAKARVMPDYFDVSSGVEESPGVKNESKMRSLFSEALK
jgi:phosphoribosylanthranilate isomerase